VSDAVTIRERALEALDLAGPQGLSIGSLTEAVTGPWAPTAVRAVIRKLWQAGELSRRDDGTFVPSGRRARDSQYRLPSSPAEQQPLEAAVRRVASATGERRPSSPLRTYRVDPALLKAVCQSCRATVLPRQDGRCTACGARTGATLEAILQAQRELAA
jgi:hypothetical protein